MYKFIFFFLFSITLNAQQIAVLKYNGGGDWYSNPTALKNLIQYCNTNISTKITSKPETVETNSVEIFNYPIVFMTGHGNVFFGEDDIENLKNYLSSGGFLHISDNYGMDTYIRREMKKVFPELDFQEIPYNHPIYHQKYNHLFESSWPSEYKWVNDCAFTIDSSELELLEIDSMMAGDTLSPITRRYKLKGKQRKGIGKLLQDIFGRKEKKK